MDVRDLSRQDLGVLAAAVGPRRRLFVSMILHAVIEQRGLHLHLDRAGHDYVLVGVEIAGDRVIDEHHFPVVVAPLAEAVQAGVLEMYLRDLVQGHEHWVRRMNLRLVGLGVRTIPNPLPANG